VPELPEIKAHAERLGRDFSGAVLASFRPLHLSALKTYDPPPEAAVGRALSGTGHRGKYLSLHFEPYTFVVHLMQGGRLRADAKKTARPRGGMARWDFEAGDALLLTEAGTEHRAGVWMVDGMPSGEPLDHLGPDADTITVDDLAAALAAESTRVHGFLRDQRRIAGLGRLLANEVLHAAKLSPFALTSKLDDTEISRLHSAIETAIAEHLAYERTLDDIGRSADRPSRVHHRVGEACERCGDEVCSVEYRRYTVAYCPGCQTDGRVLADNTTSRFLK